MALDFNGTTSLVDVGSGASLDDIATFTYLAWIKPDGAGENSRGRILNKGTGTIAPKQFAMHPTVTETFYLQVLRAPAIAAAIAATSTIVYGSWQFVVGTYESTDGPRLYRAVAGGVPAEVSYNSRDPGSGAEVTETTDNMFIGNASTSDRTFDGVMGEISVFNVVLTTQEMTSLMYGKRIGRMGNCVGYWRLDNAAAIPDLSGNGNNAGTITAVTIADHPPMAPLFGFDDTQQVMMNIAAAGHPAMRRLGGPMFRPVSIGIDGVRVY